MYAILAYIIHAQKISIQPACSRMSGNHIKIKIEKYLDLNCVSHLLHDDNLPHMIAFLMVTSAFITKQTNKGELNSFLFKSQVGFYLKNSLKIFWDNT